MTRRTLLRVVLLLAAAAPWTAAARADESLEKAAKKALTTAQSGLLRTFRAGVTAASATLSADVAKIDSDLRAHDPPADAPPALFDALVRLQVAMTAALKAAVDGQAGAAKDLVAAHPPAVEGQYLTALYPGDGTPTAKFESALDALVAKTYAATRKRVAKLMPFLEGAGQHVNFRVAPPLRRVRIWDSSRTDFFVSVPPTIDVVVASSSRDATGDGTIRVGGAAVEFDLFDDDLTLTAFFNLNSTDRKVTSANGRFTSDFDGAQFAEGIYIVGILQGQTAGGEATIGVR